MKLSNIKIYKLSRFKLFLMFSMMAFESLFNKSKVIYYINLLLFGRYVKEQERLKILYGRDYIQAEDGTPVDKELYVKNCYTTKFQNNQNVEL